MSFSLSPINFRLVVQLTLIFSSFASVASAAVMNIPIPKINSTGLGEFNVFEDTKNDTLLWKSDKVTVGGTQTENMFRLWSLENDTYYALTYGLADEDPGRVVGFCGYTAGFNFGTYDLETGMATWSNLEPTTRTIKFEGNKYRATYQPTQGEFPDVAEKFLFSFNAATNDLSMSHVAPNKPGHPFPYMAQSVSLMPNTTENDLYSKLESGTHIWNPNGYQAPDVVCLGPTGLSALSCPPSIPSEVDDEFSNQPSSVPEPTSTVSLLAIGTLGLASVLKRKQKQS